MDPETIDGTTVKLVKKGTTTPVAATLSRPAPDKVVLDPNKSLARGDTYTATIAGAGDLEGNLLDQDPATPGEQPKTWTFKVRR
jgi:hypothetical protein